MGHINKFYVDLTCNAEEIYLWFDDYEAASPNVEIEFHFYAHEPNEYWCTGRGSVGKAVCTYMQTLYGDTVNIDLI